MRIVFACLFLIAATDGLRAESARSQLDAFAEGLDTLRAEFTQTTREANGDVVETARGELLYRAPDRFRWNYTEPFPQLLIADGERLWNYDESLEQVTVREQPSPADSPLMVLTDPSLLNRHYDISSAPDAEVLEVTPRAEQAEFESASLHFFSGMPDRVVLVDRFDQRTVVELENVRRNPDLPAEAFEFEPPEGVDVLEGL